MERFLCLLSYKFNISLTNSPRLNFLPESINFPLLLIIANFRLWNYKKFTTFPFFPCGTRAGLIYFQIRWKKTRKEMHDRMKPKPKQTIKYKVEHFSRLATNLCLFVCFLFCQILRQIALDETSYFLLLLIVAISSWMTKQIKITTFPTRAFLVFFQIRW